MSIAKKARPKRNRPDEHTFESATSTYFFPPKLDERGGSVRNLLGEIQNALLRFAQSKRRTAPHIVVWSSEDPLYVAIKNLGFNVPTRLALDEWRIKSAFDIPWAAIKCRTGHGCIVIYACGKKYPTVKKSRSFALRYPSVVAGSCIMYKDWDGTMHLLNRCNGDDCHWLPKNKVVEKSRYQIVSAVPNNTPPLLNNVDIGPDGFTTNIPRVLLEFNMWWATYKPGPTARCDCTYQLRQTECNGKLIPIGHRIWKCPTCR